MNDTPENAGNGGPERLRKVWRKRARNSRKIAWRYSLGVGVLFIGAGLVAGFADWITRGTVGIASSIAVEGFERSEGWPTVTVWSGEDFRGAALDRRNNTVFVVSSGGFILAADFDSGLQWEALPSNTEKDFHGIAVSDNGGVVIAVGERGLVRRSVDRGQTWTDPGGVAPQGINAIALSGDGKTAVLVGDGGLVRRSDNGGETWTDAGIVRTEEGRPKDVNGVALSGDGKTAVLVGDGGLVRRSDDGGKTWVNPSIVETEEGRPKNVNGVALSGNGKIAVLVGNNGLAKSSVDGGKTWKSCVTDVGDDLHGVALSSDGETAVLVGDGGRVLDFDVQEKGCSNMRFGNVKTPRQFYALVLDEDSDVTIVVGQYLTTGFIFRSVERFSSRIERVGPEVRKRLTEEEELRVKEEQRRAKEQRENEAKNASTDALSKFAWQVYFYSTSLRVGIIVILMFWVGHLADLIRYHLRLAAYYDARGDAIALVGEGLSSGPSDGLPHLEKAIGVLSPDDVGFSDVKVPRNKLLAMLRRATKEVAKDS